MAGMHSLNFSEMFPGRDGWLRSGSRPGRHKRARGLVDAQAREGAALFEGLKRALVGGRWDSVHPTLAARLRARVAPAALARSLRRNASVMRKAYRDASVTAVRADDGGLVLTVDWGRAGFDFHEIRLAREGCAWRFATVPWGRGAAVRSPRPGEGRAAARSSAQAQGAGHRRKTGRRSLSTWMILQALVIPPAAGLYFVWRTSPRWGDAPLAVLLIVVVALAFISSFASRRSPDDGGHPPRRRWR